MAKKRGRSRRREVLDSIDLGDVLPDHECIDVESGRVQLVKEVFQVVAGSRMENSDISRRQRPSPPVPMSPRQKQRRRAEKPRQRSFLYSGHPSLITYWRSLTFGVAVVAAAYYGSSYAGYFGLIGWLMASLTLVYVLVDRSSRDYLVTPLRVEVVEGILSKSSREVRIEDIRAINVKTRGLIGLLGVGTVEFATAGTEAVDVAFVHVSRAHRLKKLVRRLQDQAQEKDG